MATSSQPYPVRAGIDAEDAKDMLRAAIRKQRQERSERRRAQAGEAIAEIVVAQPVVAAARCVTAYSAVPTEPATIPLLEALAARGIRVLLPVLGAGLRREWAPFAGVDDLQFRAPGRPPEPSGPTLGGDAVAEADVVIVPALAVDTTGVRLGHGGGWYDRVLAHVRPGTPVVAIVFPEEVYDATVRPLPVEPHDRRVGNVVTPAGWRRLGEQAG